MVRMVPRGVSTTADAYLTPVLSDYLDGFYQGFEGGKDGDLVVEFMGSDGGLLDLRVSLSSASRARTDLSRTLPVSRASFQVLPAVLSALRERATTPKRAQQSLGTLLASKLIQKANVKDSMSVEHPPMCLDTLESTS